MSSLASLSAMVENLQHRLLDAERRLENAEIALAGMIEPKSRPAIIPPAPMRVVQDAPLVPFAHSTLCKLPANHGGLCDPLPWWRRAWRDWCLFVGQLANR